MWNNMCEHELLCQCECVCVLKHGHRGSKALRCLHTNAHQPGTPQCPATSHRRSHVRTADRRDTRARYSGDSRVRSAWRAGGGSLGLLHTRAFLIVPVHAPPHPPPLPRAGAERGKGWARQLHPGPAGERSRRTALAISHQMSPSAAKAERGAQTMAAQAQGWAGPAPGPQSRASADTYSLQPSAAYLSPPAPPAAAAIPLALCPPPPFPPHPLPLSASSLILQEAGQASPLPGSLPPSSSHSPPIPQLDACLGPSQSSQTSSVKGPSTILSSPVSDTVAAWGTECLRWHWCLPVCRRTM